MKFELPGTNIMTILNVPGAFVSRKCLTHKRFKLLELPGTNIMTILNVPGAFVSRKKIIPKFSKYSVGEKGGGGHRY